MKKIDKILEYCESVECWACIKSYTVCFRLEIENTVGGETEHRSYTNLLRYNIFCLYNAVCQAVSDARQYSHNYNCLSSVNVFIETYDKDGAIVDGETLDEYEINFENGIEVQ